MNNKKGWLTSILLGVLVLVMTMASVGCGRVSGDGNSVAKVTPEPGFPEIDISELISFQYGKWNLRTSWDAYITPISAKLPGYDLEFSTTNSAITFYDPNIKDDEERCKKGSCIVSGDVLENGMPLFLTTMIPDSKPDEPGQAELDGSPIVVRLVIHDGDRIAGYGLLALWDAVRTDEGKFIYFGSKHVLKAVLFDEVDGVYPVVSAEKVQSFIDTAEQTLIVDAGLFEGSGK